MSPKKLKPLEVDEVTAAKSRATAKIFFDRDNKDFFAKVGDLEIRHETAEQCKRATIKALGEFNPYVWTRLIDVTINDGDDHHSGGDRGKHIRANIQLECRRYERTPKFGAKGFLGRSFEEDVTESERHFHDDGSTRARDEYVRDGEEDMPLPYSDELWAALVSIQETLEKARAHVKTLLDPKDRGKKLLALGLQQIELKQLASGGKKP